MAAQPSENELEFPFNSNREFELRLGSSFHSKGEPKTAFHTIRYDFKPASVDTTRPAELVVGDTNEVTVTVPHVQNSGTTVYRGSKRSCTKEFILVVDKDKKTFTLERIESNVPQLKKVRSSSNQSTKPVKLPVTPSTATLTKTQKNKTKNKKKPVEKKAAKQSASPAKNASPPATSSSQEISSKPEDTPISAESNSGSSSSSDGSDSEKDENEDGEEFDDKDVEKLNSLMTSMDEKEMLATKEGFNTLCEDLQLSESGSDSD